MIEVIVYTTMMCPYFVRSKALLTKKGVAFREIDVSMDYELRQEMTRLSGGRQTVPQIFISGQHVGGSDELAALDRAGKLDPLLAGV